MKQQVVISAFLVLITAFGALAGECSNQKKSQAKLICYYSKLTDIDSCKCSHVILPPNSDVKAIDRVREYVKSVKIFITVNEFNQGLVDILKSSKVDGIEIKLSKLDSKNDINDFISTVRSKLGNDLAIILAVPSKPELLAKYFDFKTLSKDADLFVLETAFLGASTNVTFHPSRLSGLWDMQNTDSVVDLVNGLGAPLSKLVITAPVQAYQFRLQSEKHTAPGSPALEVKSIRRDELCGIMQEGGNWTLERDQDQAGPYIFSKDQWIAFDDVTSIDIKAKYARVRGLAGLALKDLSQDGGIKCETTILDAAFNGLSKQARAPRGAVLHSLEREILETSPRPLDKVQVSPYRISRVIDVEGHVHVIRQDTRTEFECSRQGYFVHPRSCGRFYRCVKFDQLSDEFSVFEFDCPAGLAFDERVEVCVWPGSLPHASACSGSSEIAPVPKERFICPSEPGYYADPENCRWFFACLDHGKSPLSAYEFRCPFGLVYDESRLLCEWSWLVPRCASGSAVGSEVVYGGSGLLALDQYSGLGVLPSTTLGGLHGPLVQPVAKVYTNVGSFNSGSYAGNGLSAKSVQSLQNAGLLHAGGVASGYADGNLNYAQYAAASNLDAYQGLNSAAFGLNANSGGNLYANTGNNLYYQTGSADIGQGYASGVSSLSYGGANVHAAQGLSGQYLGTSNLNSGYSDAHLINNLANGNYGAKSQQSLTQVHGGTAGNINIVGGGYSAGVQHANVEISSNGDEHLGAYVTPSPIAVSTVASVPTVTAVPVPALKVATGFETYKGGVVANVPELQYKLQNSGIAYQTNLNSGLDLGVSHGVTGIALQSKKDQFLNLVSSTPSSLSVNLDGGYNYPKPSVAFVEGSALSQKTIGAGYVQPVVSSTQRTLVQPAIVSTNYNLHNQQQVGYDYPKPAIKFEASPVVQKVETVQQGYVYDKPAVAFEEGHLKQVQPAVVNTYSYATPSVTLKPVVQQTYVQQPIVKVQPTVQTVVQPAVSVNTFQKHETFQGYDYPKPAVAFQEVPQVQVTSYNVPSTTIKPVVYEQKQQIYVTPAPVVQQKIVQQPIVTNTYSQGYHYEKPSIAFEEKPVIYQQQQPISTYTYQAPVTAKPVTTYNYKNVLQQAVGYAYPKPAVKFEETPVVYQKPAVFNTYSYATPTAKPQIYSYQAPVVQKVQQQVVYQKPAVTYSYQTPVVQKVQEQVVYQKPAVVKQESYAYLPPVTAKPAVTYSYQTPVVQKVQEQVVYQKPAVVNTYSYATPVQTAVKQESYAYLPPVTAKPAITYSYQTPVVQKVQEQVVYQKPAVVNTYSYAAPVQTEIKQENYAYLPPVSAKPAVTYSYQTPVVQKVQEQVVYQKPAVVNTYSYARPVETAVKQESYAYLPPVTQKPAVTYSYQTPIVQKVQQQVVYQKPAIVQPIVKQESYAYLPPSTPKPAVIVQQQPVLTSYTYTAPVTSPKPAVLIQKQPIYSTYTYSTPKPEVIVPKIPAVTYSYTPVQKQVPIVQQKQVVAVQKPAVVSSYSYTAPSTVRPLVVEQKVEFKGYDYPKPAVQFYEQPKPVITYENKVPVQEEIIVPKKAYVTGAAQSTYYKQENLQRQEYIPVQQPVPSSTPRYEFQQQEVNTGYVYEKPAVKFVEKPQVVVENYQAPIAQDQVNLINYQKVQQVLLKSTPRPTFATAVNTVIAAKAKPQQEFYLYENNLASTPKPFVKVVEPVVPVSTTSRPIVRYEFSSLDDNYAYQPAVQEYEPVKISTPAPTVKIQEYIPVRPRVKVTTAAPVVFQEVVTPTREYLPVRPKVRVTTPTPVVLQEVVEPTREYLPVRSRVRVTTTPEPTREYLPVRVKSTTPIPSREYLPVKTKLRVKVTTSEPTEAYIVPEVTTPSREYLPIRSKVRLTTQQPSREYLPSAEENYVATQRPVKIVKVVRPKAKTIIKQNDFHPLLSAKLGAQCTCVSNTVKLRKQKPLKIIVQDDDDEDTEDDDDGYVVGPERDSDVIVENYEFNPQKLEVTPTPEVIISSSTSPSYDEVAPTVVRKRVRVRPATIVYDNPVTEAVELFVKKPAVTIVKSADDAPTDREIAKAVRTGLKLVKQAARDGAKEGTREALSSKDFDRYGPGGVRSRNEKLQGTVDCQRAGLFRHPTQCNKFYACRWDCNKNKFTLHVFNCPVHLTFDNNLGACNWPSQGPACLENTLLPSE